MKIKILIFLTIVVIFGSFSLKAQAEEYSEEALEDFLEILPEGMEGITEDTDVLTERVGLEALLSEIITAAEGSLTRTLSFLLVLISMGALMSVAATMCGRVSSAVECALGAVCTLVIFSQLGAVFSESRESIDGICKFFSGAVPIFTAISISSGAVQTASAQAMGMNFTLSLVGGAGISLMMSAVGMGLAMALVSFFGDDGISSLSKSISAFFKWLSGIAAALIMATLSLQSVVTSASDSATLRAVKYAASGMIPIVGGTVSGALSTLGAGLAYVKSIVGAGSVAVIVLIALAPLTVMLMYRCALSLGISFVTTLGAQGAVRIYNAFRSALDSLIAVYSLCACVCIFEVILFMKSGVSLA